MDLKVDKIDKELLFELDKNARQSSRQLARIVGINKEAALYRIKRLERKGIINGYYALIDFSKMGYFLVRAYIRLQRVTAEEEDQLISTLVQNKNTLQVYKTDGPLDIAIGVLVKNFSEFYALWEKFELKYKKSILETKTSVLFKYLHYNRNYLVEKKRWDNSAHSTGEANAISLDQKDISILKALATDAKMPAVKLAKKLGIPVTSLIYKLRQLEKKKVILGYKAMIDFDKLGYEYYKVDLYLDDISKRASVQGFLRLRPEIIYEDITIGGSDVEFDVEVKSYDDLYSLLKELKKVFPGAIRYYTFYKAKKIYKYIYVPE